MTKQLEGQMSLFNLDTWSGKMWQEPLAVTKAKTSASSSKKPRKLQIKMPLFLDLRGGRWPDAGCIMGDRYSIAWRVHDAQFWGVPQRRKRICLLADFNGDTAPKILFELQPEAVDRDTEQAFRYSGNVTRPEIQSVTEGVSGDIESGEETREEIAGVIREDSDAAIYDVRISSDGTKNWRAHAYETDISRNLDTGGATQTVTTEGLQSSRTLCLNDQGGSQMEVTENITGTLRAQEHGHQPIVYGISSYDSNAMKSSNPYSGIYEAQTTRTLDNNGGNPACNQGGMIVLEGNGSRESHKGDGYKESETMYTLNTVEQHAVCTYQKVTGTLNPGAHAGSYNGQDAYNDMLVVSVKQQKKSKDFTVYGLDRASFNQGQNAQFDFGVEEEKAQTLVSKGPGGGGGGTSETVGALCARDYKGVGSQYVDEGKCIVCYSRSSDTED